MRCDGGGEFLRRSRDTSFLFLIAAVSVNACAATARGETIWQWTHEASGSGTANVFDGEAVDTGFDATIGLRDPLMQFSAFDSTRSDIRDPARADYITSGSSRLFAIDDRLSVRVIVVTGYFSGFRIDGDHPGGEGGGTLSSVIEFVMPVDEIQMRLSANIALTTGFTGSIRLLAENLTRLETVVDLTSPGEIRGTLPGRAGDVIRVSSEIDGSGGVPAGGSGHGLYEGEVLLNFTIPEPGSIWLVGGSLMVLSRRKATERRIAR